MASTSENGYSDKPDDSSSGHILENFRIIGLHGDKTVAFTARSKTTILMARNGSGKTTLLSAINSVLTERFHRLVDIQFERIEFNFQGRPPQSIARRDVELFSSRDSISELESIARESNSSVDHVLDIAQSVARTVDLTELRRHPGLQELYRTSSSGFRVIQQAIHQYVERQYAFVPNLKEAAEEVAMVMKGFDIVYLPTYRRIEMPLSKFRSSQLMDRRQKPGYRSRFSQPEELNFGLEDISNKLEEIAGRIEGLSNAMYQNISANIINDLLDGSYIENVDESDKPEREDLELFFQRVRSSRFRPSSSVEPPDLDKIYSEDIGATEKPFLLYFLSSLNKAIKTTQPLEDRVNNFVEVCNKYISDEDYSAYTSDSIGPFNSERKRISLSRDRFRPQLKVGTSDKPIRIDALSSGEKQVVSLFARMYLYDNPKIVLFDEPELSLSIGWQQQLLPDLCAAPDFFQLISITHSPFVFDNNLDEFAANLSVSKYRHEDPELEFDFDDFDDIFDEINLDDEGKA